ncbi:putative peptidylglycine alpha-amidating monooxygenase [Betaentomopoxvirus amoorei]|uniref:AMV007 n=1 Tax=Amsacta moorei entomopoxvirus TaxID=28321 RepID=Q9EN39_AMEPV|nr:putative peptidylglycine alpha-amidating monooxygenase [Amsacta moorei entomopoxvirus]AAG02713.1 AMV007 [Amsacta moorei entomopoxvirus]
MNYYILLCLFMLFSSSYNFKLINNNICNEDYDPGICRIGDIRWYYNYNIKDCKIFIYGGCGGNMNNFNNYEDCINKCLI